MPFTGHSAVPESMVGTRMKASPQGCWDVRTGLWLVWWPLARPSAHRDQMSDFPAKMWPREMKGLIQISQPLKSATLTFRPFFKIQFSIFIWFVLGVHCCGLFSGCLAVSGGYSWCGLQVSSLQWLPLLRAQAPGPPSSVPAGSRALEPSSVVVPRLSCLWDLPEPGLEPRSLFWQMDFCHWATRKALDHFFFFFLRLSVN